MDPLSPMTYYRRHTRQTLLLVGLIALATLGVCVMVRLLDALIEQAEVSERHLTRFSLVSAIGPSLEPAVVSQIRAHPDVARVVPERSLYIGTPMNTSGGFRVFGVSDADVQFLMDICDLHLKEGRLLRPRTEEIVLSEELADALELRIGDRIGRSLNGDYYWGIPTKLTLVGILESAEHDPSASPRTHPRKGSGKPARVLTGFVSYEYLVSHELYASGRYGLIVAARDRREAQVDRFLETTVSSPEVDVWTHRRSVESLAQGRLYFHLIFSVVDCLAAGVIALVIGTIHHLALTQRLQEFGLLYADGHSKTRLIRRLTLETAAVAGIGWIAGLATSWVLFVWLTISVFPATLQLELTNLTPVWFAAPIPLTVMALSMFNITRVLWRLDPVSIIEQGKLSMEASDQRRVVKRSSAMPLSAWTFYLRHRRRCLALVVATALMLVGVAFPAFLFAVTVDANVFRFAYLHHASVVSPRGRVSIDPTVMAQIRTHPVVARVIRAARLGLTINVPPLSQNPATIHAVSEEDMQFLMNLYEMRLEEGRLPRPRSNEIAVSRPVAMNRGLHVGDKVGRPVHEDDRSIPTEMVITGILSSLARHPRGSSQWLMGFASYEYLSSHERYSSYPVGFIVVPTEGHKDELDSWLEESVASEQTSVQTYGIRLREHREMTLWMLLLCGVVESIIAVVAAVALAVLSYIFFAQRREEFGILRAMGYRRRWLVQRTVKETISAIAAAWLIGAVVCVLGLIYLQVGVYAPIGLTLDLLNPAPWLFTLPIPLAVVVASAGTIAWMLFRLDPVSIIERR
jgi:ABC-type lipoprotein release transport system permease subunit